jgi:hypothetical protein
MLRILGLILFIAIGCSAATVQIFTSSSAFDEAAGTSSFTTETFAGNQINTPGLSISACSNSTGNPLSCSGLSTSQLNAGSNYFQFITGNMFTDAVGRNPSNPYSVNFGTVFTLPNSVTAIGFDVNEKPSGTANFGVAVGTSDILYPFGGLNEGFPATGVPYTGFVGFISDTAFNSFEFSAFGNPGVSYTLDNLVFADPVPEPATFSFAALGIGLVLLKKLRRP